jgi:hypothetical protein
MAFPEEWLKAAIEAAAECYAYPQIAPEGAAVPFAIYGRESTSIDPVMYGTETVPDKPVAQFAVEVYAATYSQAKSMALSIRQAVHNFHGEANGVTIRHSYLTDEKDGDPVFFDAQDRPTFLVQLSFTIRWQE